jgi:hypothetical protein
MCIWNRLFLPSARRLAVASISGLRKLLGDLRLAVVGVQADQDVVLLREQVGGLGEDDAAEGGILDAESGGELAAAGRELDDPVGLDSAKAFRAALIVVIER